MKIVFLCGSLEPGRDGVGDYVRRLGVELQQHGHQVHAIALNDRYATVEVAENQKTPQGELPTLRLAATTAANVRFARAKQWLEKIDPDWLSLQFVSYSFQAKGLPFNLGSNLHSIGQGRRWHVMMHELWIGMSTDAPMHHVWLAKLQRLVIKRLLSQLSPEVITTQTLLYQAHLAKLGFTSLLLPLFSNISNSAAGHSLHIPERSHSSQARDVSLILFGFIHPGAPVEQLALEAAQFAKRRQVLVTLTMVGRCGSEQDRWVKCWKDVGLPVKILGEQSPETISTVLLEASLGIVTTPALLLGKSGTAAAMREHGLPILCVAAPWHPRGFEGLSRADGRLIYQEGNFESYLAAKPDSEIVRLPDIAKLLTESFLASI